MFRQFGGGKGPTENSWNTKIQSHPAPWRCKNYMVFPMLRVIFVTKILTRLLLYFWCLLWQIFLGFFCWQKMMFPSRGCWKKKRYTQKFPSKNVIWKLTQLPVFRRLKRSPTSTLCGYLWSCLTEMQYLWGIWDLTPSKWSDFLHGGR